MFRLRRWYNQNSTTIWKVTGFVVFLILLIQTLNYFAGRKNNIEYKPNKESPIQKQYTDVTLSSEKSVLSDNKISEDQTESIQVINSFYNYCNKGEFQEAYKLLTDECKEEMYPKIKDFRLNYYNTVFNGEKKNISIENWYGNIYKVEICNDLLSTGIYDENSVKQEYIAVEEMKGNEYRININGYIGRRKINKTQNFLPNIDLTVQCKDIYMDYEIYTFKIKNNTNNKVLLDNLKDINSMYIIDRNNVKYFAYTHEMSLSELLINEREERVFKIKYYNKYGSNKQIDNIVFTKVITEYTSKLSLEDYHLFKDYKEFKVEL